MSDRRDESEERRWLRFAREDLASARVLSGSAGIAPSETCTLCQQAAEKALKAVLIAERTRIPRTHDLVELRDRQRDRVAPGIGDDDLELLSTWMFKGRYPGDWDEPDAADARTALAAADAVVASAEARLGGADGAWS